MMEALKKDKKHLIEGNINPDFISELIAKHQSKDTLGAHSIFLGQVRADETEGKKVTGIDYSAYDEMAEKEILNIKEDFFQNYELGCLHIFHSTGRVNIGEISLFVMVSAVHRQDTFDILKDIVEQIKHRVPIWKKEIFDDGSERWIKEKTNL